MNKIAIKYLLQQKQTQIQLLKCQFGHQKNKNYQIGIQIIVLHHPHNRWSIIKNNSKEPNKNYY